MKKAPFILILLSLAIGLSGCLGMKKDVKKTKKTKKVAQASGSGIPLARYEKGNKRFWDDRVEAFVLEEDDKDHRYAPTVAHTDLSTAFSEDVQAAEEAWSQEAKSIHSFEPLYFSYDDYTIRKDQDAAMQYDTEQVKDAVKKGKMVRVEGHSDKQCISETYNMAVSQKRAHTVSNRLVKAGIARDSIKSLGYGDTHVAVDSPGREQLNRRVEFVTLVS
jgi:outer membrane protein OmpA-like peptidoglycan-associated protein